MNKNRYSANPVLNEKPFITFIRNVDKPKKNKSKRLAKEYVKTGIAPWKVVIILIIGLYIIVLPYSTTNSFQTSIGEVVTACVTIVYSGLLSIFFIRMIPARDSFCKKQKLIKQVKKQQLKRIMENKGKNKGKQIKENKIHRKLTISK